MLPARIMRRNLLHCCQRGPPFALAFLSAVSAFSSTAPAFSGSSIMQDLQALDKLTVTVVMDNECDSISRGCSVDGFIYKSERENRRRKTAETTSSDDIDEATGLYKDPQCQASHGLSFVLQAQAGLDQHTIVLDGGADPVLWQQNAEKLDLDLANVETLVLSHYHYDHSAGLRGAVPAIVQARQGRRGDDEPLIVDLQVEAIQSRGGKNAKGDLIKHKPENPTAKELLQFGAQVQFHEQEHTVGNNLFYISGKIPRITGYEAGFPGHFTLNRESGKWEEDTLIMDERYIACHVKGRGLVVFSACSHAGIVNVCRDAVEQAATGVPLFGVVGGLHLAGGKMEDRIAPTVVDLKALNPQVVIAGHCTGWRAKNQLAVDFPGKFQPLAVGARYEFLAPN